ncbi:hypothetical protein Acsp03_34410 [Actinomadura sp. NBRC 104412]|uniref:hypothetical protein n=1 Tax=Actinomadura sp. NBRC 104412 TaxID=3032203 RepID=UPI0024A2D3D4|nr:hypothetical protein [Actinomadura sp. NBRC 104412]GLZ05975.1 hypothetical protein Acsp03_34410 [Actinomadura sp. NBRC 104412]
MPERPLRADVLTLLGRADHLRALSSVTAGDLLTGHPLDDPSHILLRELAWTEGMEAVRSYLSHPSEREAALARVLQRLRAIDLEPLQTHDPRALLPITTGLVAWADERSFAVFRPGAREHRHGHSFTAAHELAASASARRYYAFSVPDHPGFYYQPTSIAVVAAGWDWLAEHGDNAPGLTPAQRYAAALLRQLPGNREDQARDLFLVHEAAHTLELNAASPALQALERTGHDPADAFSHGLPTRHHLGAWDRLAKGEGDPSRRTFDITFVLSDVLATWTQSIAYPGHPLNRLQAAYLWQVVTSPSPQSLRRGTITSLRAAELLDLPALARDLEEVLSAALTAPHTVPVLLKELEDRSRRLLQERFHRSVLE